MVYDFLRDQRLMIFCEDEVLFEGSAEEYADNYIKETGLLDQISENPRYYFDTKAFACDMLLYGASPFKGASLASP